MSGEDSQVADDENYLVVYPVGAGGSFLRSLVSNDVYPIDNNEFMMDDKTLWSIETPIVKWQRAHDPTVIPDFVGKTFLVWSSDISIRKYVNALGSLKLYLNNKRCPTFSHIHTRAIREHTWDSFTPFLKGSSNKTQLIRYEEGFFNYNLLGTPFYSESVEEKLLEYTYNNISLMRRYNLEKYIPYEYYKTLP